MSLNFHFLGSRISTFLVADNVPLQIVNDTVSLHGLKKKLAEQGVASPTLKHYFNEHFGGEGSPAATLVQPDLPPPQTPM
jgi:hypothetical protein